MGVYLHNSVEVCRNWLRSIGTGCRSRGRLKLYLAHRRVTTVHEMLWGPSGECPVNRRHVIFNEGLHDRIWAVGKNILSQFAHQFSAQQSRKVDRKKSIWRFDPSLPVKYRSAWRHSFPHLIQSPWKRSLKWMVKDSKEVEDAFRGQQLKWRRKTDILGLLEMMVGSIKNSREISSYRTSEGDSNMASWSSSLIMASCSIMVGVLLRERHVMWTWEFGRRYMFLWCWKIF